MGFWGSLARAGLVLALAGVGFAGTAQAATAGPQLLVNRTAGLLDGDIVEFSVKGGPPKAYVWVELCAPDTVAGACDEDTARQFRVLPDGTLQVAPKKLYAQLATGSGPFDCRTAAADRPCRLALTDNTGAVLTTVPLRFRPHGALEAAPTVRVNPYEGLVDGQSVHVTGRGYEPRYHSVVLECAAGSPDAGACRTRGRPPATTDQGRLDETLTLSATFTANDGRTVDCRVAPGCELVVHGTRVRGPEFVKHPLHFATAPAPAGG
ncbi:neocarzinostatin apoprotein domain-containing protein [Streptomyces sp. NBC_00249]|uniref:neocarzinostatin apoprotein domain-containing protein n=1 Tax=Streptomyces sp. NBC_00249 TaxID=2975690 RepID=UPI00224FA332|nr:neocarzinostatin apoprotein domain-containing protein [Streptomyces sp. NBC_00249]MCX5193863.1 neocarzinostatin apoprotein domain-containing protein [Streptomyces sp. NBC_00249]